MMFDRKFIGAALFTVLPAAAALAQGVPDAVPAPVAAPVAVVAPAVAPAEAAAPAAKTAAEQAQIDKDNEMICHREREIASLVKTKKTCHTRAQWAYIQAENQRQGRDFVTNNQGRPSGN